MAAERLRLPIYEPPAKDEVIKLLAVPSENDFGWSGWYEWQKPSPLLKRHLTAAGIEPIPEERNAFCLSNLDSDIDFDPLRVEVNPLGENYDVFHQAAASFGLQKIWWRSAHDGMVGLSFRPSQAMEVRVTPVFKYQDQYYLAIKDYGYDTFTVGIN